MNWGYTDRSLYTIAGVHFVVTGLVLFISDVNTIKHSKWRDFVETGLVFVNINQNKWRIRRKISGYTVILMKYKDDILRMLPVNLWISQGHGALHAGSHVASVNWDVGRRSFGGKLMIEYIQFNFIILFIIYRVWEYVILFTGACSYAVQRGPHLYLGGHQEGDRQAPLGPVQVVQGRYKYLRYKLT